MRVLSEFRFAARSLARSPTLAAVAVLSLALGIGANATIFNFVNAIQFRPLPFPEPDRLVAVSEVNPKELCVGCGVGTSWSTFQLWRAGAQSFAGLGAYHEDAFALADQGEPERVGGATVTANVFPILGIAPVLGRGLVETDDRPGAPAVVLLAHGLWLRRFGGDSAIIGRTVRINGISRTVIGIMPPRFGFPEFAALWIPLTSEVSGLRDADRALGVVGRLKPAASVAKAGVEMAGIAARLAAEQPRTQEGWTAVVTPLKEDISHDTSSEAFLLALAASGFVLLIACANLANLFLARATTRARELAVRVALGASRSRIAIHVLAESVLLGLAGGVVGFLLSLWGVRLLLGAINSALPFWIRLGSDWRFVLYTLLVSIAVGVAFGSVPALRAARTDLNEALKTGGVGATAGRRDSRVRGTLVVAQIALAIVLLAGAGLMIKSFLLERRTENLGYNPRGVLTARLQLQAPRYDDPAQVRLLQAQLLERLRVQPLVEAAAIEYPIFLNSFIGRATRVQLEGAAEPVPTGGGPGHGNAVSADYFRLMAIPILSGRGFAASDGPGAPPVVMLNRQAASLYWPHADPLGKRLRIGDTGPWLTVVGVVGDIANRPYGRGNIPLLYTSLAQESARPFRLMIRFHGDPATAATTLKAVTRTVDADEPVEDLLTLEADLALQVTPLRFMAILLGTLGAIALGLATFGVYGVMSYLVARRARELGIRAALGAEAADLWRFVVRRGLRLALLGVALGLFAAFGLTRVLRQALFNVRATDPEVFVAVSLLLTGVAILACWAPARRATRVDPLVALKSE
jgi:putative ABC transport system permease protein